VQARVTKKRQADFVAKVNDGKRAPAQQERTATQNNAGINPTAPPKPRQPRRDTASILLHRIAELETSLAADLRAVADRKTQRDLLEHVSALAVAVNGVKGQLPQLLTLLKQQQTWAAHTAHLERILPQLEAVLRNGAAAQQQCTAAAASVQLLVQQLDASPAHQRAHAPRGPDLAATLHHGHRTGPAHHLLPPQHAVLQQPDLGVLTRGVPLPLPAAASPVPLQQPAELFSQFAAFLQQQQQQPPPPPRGSVHSRLQ
jgi:hypothetical protein